MNNLPVIILKGIVALPHNDLKLDIDDNFSKEVINLSNDSYNNRLIVVSDTNILEESIDINELPKYGVLCEVSYKIKLPNNKIRIILNLLKRVSIKEYNKDNVVSADYTYLETKQIAEEPAFINKLIKEVKLYIDEIPYISNSILDNIKDLDNLDQMIDIVASYLQINYLRMIEYLKEEDTVKRYYMILQDINNEKEEYKIERQIDSKIKKNIDDNQRDFILREKIKVIKEELNDVSIKENEIKNLRDRASNLKANESVKDKIETEIRRYELLSSTSPDLSVTRNYIEYLLDLPWSNYTIDNDDLIDVRNKLDSTHSGLEEVKSRIIEYLAVKQFTNNLSAPIICLVGPPGVGKTSLASSIASAMHRNFVKISVGGVNDEAEIIGHRKTYVGAAPGRIIASLKKAKSSNPVFLIDEIDKMTKTIKGDPASALLEVLDPNQNKYFIDNYLEEEYDLSRVFFILTANYASDIPEALYDRLEIINLCGYTEYEKLDIAKNYLLPRICKEHGINVDSIKIKEEDILKIIKRYTKEAGVRELERVLSKIIRKVVCSLVGKKINKNHININYKTIIEYLGKEKYLVKRNETKSLVGVVNGLAYTPLGGSILPIEVNSFKGKGKITITGLIGDVMKESSLVALDYIKSNKDKFIIKQNKIDDKDIHIHVPEGGISKDGPSAGIALTTALISLFLNKKVNRSIAMTGEITLRGKVLPVGGLKEKIIGAYQGGIKKIIIPYDNQNDIDELPIELKDKIEFIFVKNYMEVYREVFQ